MDLVDYIYEECHRQHVTNYGDFAKAWQLAMDWPLLESWEEFAFFVTGIARRADEQNLYRGRRDNLRTCHVGFAHGGKAAPTGEVRERFDRWCDILFEWMNDVREAPPQNNEMVWEVDTHIKNLLDIHPWVDGNGRTASILRNWLLGTLQNPEPLPYYYGNA